MKSLASINELIVSGQRSEARNRLSFIDLEKVKQQDSLGVEGLDIAKLLVRSGLCNTALTLLYPRIHGESRASTVSLEEQLVYCLALIRIGAHAEALNHLNSLNSDFAEVHLYRSFIYNERHEFASTIESLSKLKESRFNDSYEEAVGKLTLLRALIETQDYVQANSLLHEINSNSRSSGWSGLYLSTQDLSALLAFRQKEFSGVSESMEKISTAARNGAFVSGKVADQFMYKWSLFTALSKNPSPDLLEKLREFAGQSARQDRWETAREATLMLAELTRDAKLLTKVYYGTPSFEFRKALTRRNSDWYSVPARFELEGPAELSFDLLKASCGEGGIELPPGKAVHRFLISLTEDSYQPRQVGHLHSKLFLGENFNPSTSPVRIANIVQRFRDWASQNNLPVAVWVRKRFYSLEIGSGFNISIPLEMLSAPQAETLEGQIGFDSYLSRLRAQLKNQEFSSRQVADLLNVSKSVAVRMMNWGVENSRLQRSGRNRSTVYKIVE